MGFEHEGRTLLVHRWIGINLATRQPYAVRHAERRRPQEYPSQPTASSCRQGL